MNKISHLLIIIISLTVLSCATVQDGVDTDRAVKRSRSSKSKENRLKGTNTEIMNAFKNMLPRYEFNLFSHASLKIVTKIKKIDESNPYYAKHKKTMDLYEKYEISMTREEYEIVVDIKYSILVQELNMKTNTLGFREIAREKKAEKELLKKVKRLLYGS